MSNKLKALAAELGGTYVQASSLQATSLSPEQIKVLNEAGFDINARGFNWEPRLGCFFTVSDDGSIWYKLVLYPNIRIMDINHIAGNTHYLCMADQLEKVAGRFYKMYVAVERALGELAIC